MNKKVKFVVSCLSFVMCLFVVISAGIHPKVSAYNGESEHILKFTYQPLLPFSYSSIKVNNNYYIDNLIPFEYYCTFITNDGSNTGEDHFYYLGDYFDGEIIIGHETYIYDLGKYKKADWVYGCSFASGGAEWWDLGFYDGFVPKEMNEVGYYNIRYNGAHDLYLTFDLQIRWYNSGTGGIASDYLNYEFELSGFEEINIYEPLKIAFNEIYRDYNVSIIDIYDCDLNIYTPDFELGIVEDIGLSMSFPIFTTDDYAEYLHRALYPLDIEKVYIYELDWFEQVVSDINSFMSIEILPDISFYDILIIAIAIPLLVAILKVWLGG